MQNGSIALLNASVTYPFGKNLSHNIEVTLPEGSSNITVLSGGVYTIDGNVVTWTVPTDWITIAFTPPAEAVALTNVSTSKSGCDPTPTVGSGFNLTLYATVANNGVSTQVVNATFYANSTVIGVNQTILDPGANTTLTLEWNTTGVDYGNYTVSITINDVGYPGISDWVFVTIPGDVDGDKDVDIFDIVRMAGVYGVNQPNPRYNPNADIDGDGKINIFDIVRAAGRYGDSW